MVAADQAAHEIVQRLKDGPLKADDMARIIARKFKPLLDVAKTYRDCRHGSVDCFCTKEARMVLFGVEVE